MKRGTWKRVLSVFLAAVLFMGTPLQRTTADESMPVIEVQPENMVNIQIVDSEGNCPDGVYAYLYDETGTRMATWILGDAYVNAESPLWMADNFWVPYSVLEDTVAPYEAKDYEVISGHMTEYNGKLSFNQGEDTVVEVGYVRDREADYKVPANSVAVFVNDSWEDEKRERDIRYYLEMGDESKACYLKGNVGVNVYGLTPGDWKIRVGYYAYNGISVSSEETEYVKVRKKLSEIKSDFQDDGTLLKDGVVVCDLTKELGETSAFWAIISGSVITIPQPDEDGYIEFYVLKDTREYGHFGVYFHSEGNSPIGGNRSSAYDTKQIMFKPYTYPTDGRFFANVPAGTYTMRFVNHSNTRDFVCHDAGFVAKDTKELQQVKLDMHELTYIKAVGASCSKAGNEAYYLCSCGRLFEDDEAEVEITDRNSVIIPQKPHQYYYAIEDEEHLRSEAANCQEKDTYWKQCINCEASAGDDPAATEAYFESDEIGAHQYDTTQWAYQEVGGHAHQCTLCDAHDTVEAHTPGAEATETTPQTCTVCGYELAPVVPHVHRLTGVTANGATCTEAGNKAYYTCGCGKWFEDAEATVEIIDKDSVVIDALGHDYTEKLADNAHLKSEASNCQEKNMYWYDCSRCAANAKDDAQASDKYYTSEVAGEHPYDTTQWAYKEADGHAHKCTLCTAHDTVEAHTPGAEATETTPQTCTVCGYELAPIVPHVHRLTGVTANEATCTEAGNKAYYTCVCGKWFEDAEATVEITDKDSVVIDALGHDYTEKLADNAHLKSEASNCQEKDVYWYDCSRCEANAKEDAQASDKYYTSAEIGAHQYDTTQWAYQEADGHAHQCTLCDTYDTVEAHTPGAEATETTPQTCTVCGYELAPIVPHVHKLTGVSANAANCTEAGNKAYYTCVCGKWFEDAQAAVEITDKDSVKIKALGHKASDWKYDEEEHWTVCTATACGVVIEGSLAGHDYGTDNVCDTCGYVKVVPTPEPTAVPTAEPTPEPTAVPTAEPTAVPTAAPTAAPTPEPTAVPTAEPTAVPTAEPTAVPTAAPTVVPTAVPTAAPTSEPTAVPTAEPTAVPTVEPTAVPTAAPTAVPTVAPTAAPTATPTVAPMPIVTLEPVKAPKTADSADKVWWLMFGMAGVGVFTTFFYKKNKKH